MKKYLFTLGLNFIVLHKRPFFSKHADFIVMNER